ncbi:hypothetical protein ACO22_06571 [Paracoccidioides brasiliensis]|uniref:Uncharacterized protein n=1 Tax=Paracoccidioides brasiliensis TaxID=121759 RepID=A0A1D2J720_PARBR|nr:hypothetical protein ACO22_06571 [Paracoccidioides brasiliensis]
MRAFRKDSKVLAKSYDGLVPTNQASRGPSGKADAQNEGQSPKYEKAAHARC